MNLLIPNEITEINSTIADISQQFDPIEYVTAPQTYIRTTKLIELCECAPTYNLLDTATYYMKNLILLQIYPDANHRTSLASLRLFYHKNNIDFMWDPTWVAAYQREIYKLRYRIYNTYEELSTAVLHESQNHLYCFCKQCIMVNLSQQY